MHTTLKIVEIGSSLNELPDAGVLRLGRKQEHELLGKHGRQRLKEGRRNGRQKQSLHVICIPPNYVAIGVSQSYSDFRSIHYERYFL